MLLVRLIIKNVELRNFTTAQIFSCECVDKQILDFMYVNQLRLFTECTKRKPQLADKLKLLFFIVFWFAVIANQGGMSRPLNCQPTRRCQ